MQKTLISLALAALLAGPLSAFANIAPASAASINTAVRGQSTQTVYWYANDGKRYVFPNAATYFTWFTSFDNVQNISDSELFTIPLGGNVTYRPGAKLVKVTTDPKVYAVARGGILRHVTSEYLATQLYGSNWASMVQDVPDAYFTNYTVGSPIYSTTDYNVSNEYNGVVNPGDSLRTSGQNNNNNQTGALSFTADRTSISSGQAVYLTATYNGSLPSGSYIDIRDLRSNNVVKTCYSTAVCTVTVYPYVDSQTGSAQYFAAAREANGNTIANQYSQVIYLNGSSYQNGTLNVNADRTNITNGQSVNITADYNANIPSGGRIDIKELRNNTVVKSCYNASSCNSTVYPYTSGYSSTQYSATVYDASGNQIVTQYGPTIYFDGSNGQTGTLTLTSDRTNITSGQSVTLNANYNNSLNGGRIEIKEVSSSNIVKACYDTTYCSVTVYPNQNASTQYVATVFNNSGSIVGTQYSPTIYINGNNGSSNNNGSNYINGLTLQADRTSLNSGDRVHLTANAFNTGSWNYTGNRIEIRDIRTGSIVATCRDQSWCVTDVNVYGYNGTSQYEARIYDRNGNFLMSQMSPVIYVNSGSSSYTPPTTYSGQIPNTDMYITPTYNMRPGYTVYLTASFTNLSYATTNAVIRIYMEGNSTALGSCTGSTSCSVPYTIPSTGSNTRVYGVASNGTSGYTLETARIPLISN